MTPSSDYERLVAVLERARAHGALGSRPVTEVIDHAHDFVEALPAEASSVVDLGTGAGIPGLVIALERPAVHVTMVDRRAKRIDALQRAIVALGWESRATAVVAEVDQLSTDPQWQWHYDAVVARGFADPHTTLRLAARLAQHGGSIIISEPPAALPARWEPAWLQECRVSMPERRGRVVRFHVEHGRHPEDDVPRGTSSG